MNNDKSKIIARLTHPGIIPVIRLNSTDQLFGLLDALYEGGVSCAELTMTIPNAVAVLRQCRQRYDDLMVLGMGTVIEASQAREAIAAGAQFLVSPLLAFEALAVARDADIPFLMGAFSPTEVYQAHKAGADFVKIFPVNCLPLQYIKDLRGPLPQVKFIPTGGITLNLVEPLFQAGVTAMGVGGDLVDKKAIEQGNWKLICAKARQFVAAAEQAKKH